MNVFIKLFFLLIVNLTVSKDINETLRFYRNSLLNLSSFYDYKIKFILIKDNFEPTFPYFYFFIATELNNIPLDITYSFGGENITSKNISIYHEERKGKFNSFFLSWKNLKKI